MGISRGMGMMKPRRIDLHIETLSLEGFDPADHPAIAEAVQLELTRLLAGSDFSSPLFQGGSRGGSIDQLEDGHLDVAWGDRPDTVGTQVARSVYGLLGTDGATSRPKGKAS